MTRLFRVPNREIQDRIRRIQTELQQEQIEAAFIAQRVDLFYFTGTAQNGYLYIPAEGEPALFVRRYAPRARIESGLEWIVEIHSVKELTDRIVDFFGPGRARIGFELDVLPVREFEYYRSLLAPSDVADISPLILKVRSVKSHWELAQIDAAAALSEEIFAHMRTILAPGLTEMAFAGLVEAYARDRGHGGMLMSRNAAGAAYPWHVVAGKSGGAGGALDSPVSGEGTSPAFPSGAGHRRLAAGEPIMVDFGTVLNGYHMDETRMFAIGSMPEKAHNACRAAIETHDSLIEAVRPGVVAGDLFDQAVSHAKRLGYEEAFLGLPGYKSGFIGHGIGAELVEPPMIARNRTDVLLPGMTIALEPKMCFAGEFGVGIESVVAVTENGCRKISRVPTDIVVV
ncbi:MAG: Xaa-Pro peptidase family protein [Desulfobacterales bacterium]|nr:Xaa-Pro peptidase family protein [Desulfobacterales bacterium]